MQSARTSVFRTTEGRHLNTIYLVIALTGLLSCLTLRLADPLYRGLGRTGIHVFSRVLALILAAIAVQLVLDGLKASGIGQ